MAIPLVYDAQLVIMLTSELKATLKAEADERKVSLGQVAREHIEASIRRGAGTYGDETSLVTANGDVVRTLTHDELAHIERDMRDPNLGNGPSHTRATYPDADTATDAEEQLIRNRLDAAAREGGPTLAELAAGLGSDEDGDDVDGVAGGDEAGLRLARLHARGLG